MGGWGVAAGGKGKEESLAGLLGVPVRSQESRAFFTEKSLISRSILGLNPPSATDGVLPVPTTFPCEVKSPV